MSENPSDAAFWLARLREGPLSAEEAVRFEDWLVQRPEHRAAFEGLVGVWDLLGSSAGSGELLDARRAALGWLSARRKRRRPLRKWIAAGTACLLLVAVGWTVWERNLSVLELRTGRGEARQAELSDGSLVELDAATRISVRVTLFERSVRLAEGRAHFKVAHERLRPFRVTADSVTAEAIGTAFDVAHLGRQVSVAVTEGTVGIAGNTGGWRGRLQPSERFVLSLATQQRTVGRIDPEKEFAWLQGLLDVDGRSLGQVLEELKRYSEIAIELDDPALSRLQLSGLIDPRDVRGFAKALARMRPVRVTEDGPTRIRLAPIGSPPQK